MKIVINNMAIIIVVRIFGIWLFNVTLSHNLYNGVRYMARKSFTLVYFLIAFSSLFLIGCLDNSISGPGDKGLGNISTRYISEDSVSHSCFYPWSSDATRDSLLMNGKRYTISPRSRYRMDTIPSEMFDVIVEGPINSGADYMALRDTKTDTIYIVMDCASLNALRIERGE